MTRRYFAIIFLVISLGILFVSPAAAQTTTPTTNPTPFVLKTTNDTLGVSCGVGYPENLEQDPNREPNLTDENEQKHACCFVPKSLNVEVKRDKWAGTIPVIGPMIDALVDLAYQGFGSFPKSFIHLVPLAAYLAPNMLTIDELKEVLEKRSACASGVATVIGEPPKIVVEGFTNTLAYEAKLRSDQLYDRTSCYCRSAEDVALKTIMGMCTRIKNANEQKECLKCLGYNTDAKPGERRLTRDYDKVGIWTGIGCVKTNLRSFIQDTVFRLGIGLAGLVALGCIIYSALLIQFSRGNAEQLQTAQEMLRSCIFGLLLIIFSVFILRVIGVDILKIPGFS